MIAGSSFYGHLVEERAVIALNDLARRLGNFDARASLDIARVDESCEIAERFLNDARRAMPGFANDDREWFALTVDERTRICERALRYAKSAAYDAAEAAGERPYGF